MNFIKHASKLYIGGEWVSAAESKLTSIVNPMNAVKICEVPEASATDVDHAVKAANNALLKGPWYNDASGSERRDMLLKISSLIEQNKDKLATIESLNTGKILSDSLWEIQDCADQFKFYSGFADKVGGRYVSFGTTNAYEMHTMKEPVGVCGMISSFNYPLNLITWKIAPALAMGNTVIVKPAPQTPLSMLFLAQLISETGTLPKGVLNVVTGGAEAGVAMVNHKNIDKISFTGSVYGGKAVSQGAANSVNFKAVSLELGGKSPVVVMNDADLDNAADNIIAGAFSNTGMNCSAGSKLYIQSGVYSKLLEILKKKTEALAKGITLDYKTSSLGPLIDETLLNKVTRMVDEAVSANKAKVLVGGKRWGNAGYYYEPTILVDVDSNANVAKNEIFGPVLSVMKPFDDLDGVIQIESESEFGLACGIFSSSTKTVYKFKKTMRAGTTWVNMYNPVTPDLPFGGFKASGIGRELGHEVINEYLTTRSVMSDHRF